MDTLSSDILSKILNYCSWEDRLLRLRLVNTKIRSSITFQDLRRLKISSLERCSLIQSEKAIRIEAWREYFGTDDSPGHKWFKILVTHCLPILGPNLKALVLDSNASSIYRFAWVIDANTMYEIVTNAPNLREIDFDKSKVADQGYPHLLALVPTLRGLAIRNVENATALGYATIHMRLEKLTATGNDVWLLLNTSDNSLIRKLCLDDRQSQPAYNDFGRYVTALLRFPNLEIHHHKSGHPTYDANDPAFSAYAKFSRLKKSAFLKDCEEGCLRQVARDFPNLNNVKLSWYDIPIPPMVLELFRNLRILSATNVSIEALLRILSMQTLKKLTVQFVNSPTYSSSQYEIPQTRLRYLKISGYKLSVHLVRDILKRSDKIQELVCSSSESVSSALVDYVSRLGVNCRLRSIWMRNGFVKEDFFRLLSQPVPKLRRLNVQFNNNEDMTLFNVEPGKLPGLHHLTSIKLVNLQDHHVLERILYHGHSLERITWSSATPIHSEGVFYYIGNHRCLDEVRIQGGADMFDLNYGYAGRLARQLLIGRKAMVQNGYGIRPLKIEIRQRFIDDVGKQLIQELNAMKITLIRY